MWLLETLILLRVGMMNEAVYKGVNELTLAPDLYSLYPFRSLLLPEYLCLTEPLG